MAEAMVDKMCSDSSLAFASAGTHPAERTDEKALRVLAEESIRWEGKPKSFEEIDKPDVLVTMGCDVVCPRIPGVKTVAWEIPDPRGKEMETYRQVARMIKEHLSEFLARVGCER